jgi:hypothetical protein
MTTPRTAANAPDDLGARLLHLIDGIRSADDLSPERLESLAGIPVQRDPEDSGRYGFGTPLDDAWACNLSTIPERGGRPPKRLVISYDDLAGRADATVTAAAPEFEAFAQRLRDAGYDQQIVHGPRGAIWGHRFARGGVEIDVRTEREDPMANPVRLRVSRMTLDASTQAASWQADTTGGQRHV